MDEYMSASDLIVGKPAALTTCEALAKGLCLCHRQSHPRPGRAKLDHLLERGCAIRSNKPRKPSVTRSSS
jgi:hypothetical protein